MSHNNTRLSDTHCTDEYPYTLLGCTLGHHYKVVEWFALACSIPVEVSLEVSVQITKGPILHCVVLRTIHSFTHSFPTRWIPRVCTQSAAPVDTPRLDSTTYYVRPYPYRLIVALLSWVVAP
jgi:hypothetical protein